MAGRTSPQSSLKISIRAEQAFFARFPFAEQSGVASPTGLCKSLYSQLDQPDDTLLLNAHPPAEHLGFRNGIREAYSPYALFNQGQRRLSEDSGRAIHLPQPKRLRKSLDHCLFQRRSRSQFASNKTVSAKSLATLLYYGAGSNGQQRQWFDWAGNSWEAANHFHTYPSAGALYPIHLYLRLRQGNALSEGWYRYQALSHSLLPLNITDAEELSEDSTIASHHAQLWIVLVYQVWRNRHKYGYAAAPFALMEIGAIIQNLYLASEALGWACCSWGAFPRSACERVLQLDGLSEQALHAVCVGRRE